MAGVRRIVDTTGARAEQFPAFGVLSEESMADLTQLLNGWIALLVFMAVVRALVAFFRREELEKPARDAALLILVVCGLGFANHQFAKQKVMTEAEVILVLLSATMQINRAVAVEFEQGSLNPDTGKDAAHEIWSLRPAMNRTAEQLQRFPILKKHVVSVVHAAYGSVNQRAEIAQMKEKSKVYFAQNSDQGFQAKVTNIIDESIQKLQGEDEKLKAEIKKLCVYLEHPEEPLKPKDLQEVKKLMCSDS
ncbi:hypothetical protein AGMMS49543_05570 [Betaproteobacteria bacterium]|nr:hypothetical protein AGMMS49543_05570 [Betaproteobacteria bacterium]GHU23429.1 hypothetical protein AGMMS50243_24810 [Betaproteobacteria bacterium]